jgi:hypothetical protein
LAWPAVQIVTTQVPPEQVAEAGLATFAFVQTAPHAPQLLVLVDRLTSQPSVSLSALQSVKPAPQAPLHLP